MDRDNDGFSAQDLAHDIATRSDELLQQMGQLRKKYHAVRGPHLNIPGLTILMDGVRQERKAAQSYLDQQMNGHEASTDGLVEARPAESRLRFTNVPAIERNWDILKRCQDLVSIEQSIPKTPKVEVKENGGLIVHRIRNGQASHGTGMVFVHAVIDGGAEWLRIVNKDEKRVLLELAAGGWDWDSEEEDADHEDDSELFEDIPILRTAKELADTARKYWHDYHRPRIRILLNRIEEGQSKEMDRVIQKMRSVSGDDITVTVDCADAPWISPQTSPDLDTALSKLVPIEDMDRFGSTVILDTSVLIALISDISHNTVDVQPWHNQDCKAQIQDEANGINFLTAQAYPPLRGKRLVCTREAMEHFREITSTIASPTELERARVLCSGGPRDFQELSIHPVPDDFMLPVQVLSEETDLRAKDLVQAGKLPEIAIKAEKHLLSVPGNRTTHLLGWCSGMTVVTSNRSLAKRLVRIIENSLERDYEDGPMIFTLPYNRALATKGPKKVR
ncbi:hypothetical protein J7T55_013423 [Diaporthe amygdali]|uniref:uncharacterized protein n=1 Tax=Phomopsis amygdali TaxID=1214568 RepID=UPI0022FF24F3|nr:uncharacterized protein J7T55_013423 [Diaporthe amygdali]KAJ0119187.1 hypothetical protein J7T55_013423 [Diaporthe amygdali]